MSVTQLFRTLFEPTDWIQLRSVKRSKEAQGRLFPLEAAVLHAMDDNGVANCFFGVNPRDAYGKVPIVRSIWVDVDAKDFRGQKTKAYNRIKEFLLPPTAVVDSGGGYHVYWKLTVSQEPTDELKEFVRRIQLFFNSDILPDPERLFRVPGTLNIKYTPPVECTLIDFRPTLTYTLDSLVACGKLPPFWQHIALTGETDLWGDRSRRDWAFCVQALRCGIHEADLRLIFETQAIGDKYRDKEVGGEKYMDVTISGALEYLEKKRGVDEVQGITEQDTGLYIQKGKTPEQLTTWVFQPKTLLLHESDQSQSWVGTMRTSDQVWNDVILPVQSFNSRSKLLEALTEPAWEFFGSDLDAVKVRAWIYAQAEATGIPTRTAVAALGRYDDVWFWKMQLTMPPGKQFAFVPPKGIELLNLNYELGEEPVDIAEIGTYLTKLNRAEVIWPILGWFAITPAKPIVMKQFQQFPLLNVYGTTGCGKSTLVSAVAQAFGYVNPRFFSVRQTPFVRLRTLSLTNAIPVLFDEYRPSEMGISDRDSFHQVMIELYNGVTYARGRSDLTVLTLPMIAPTVICGEEPLEVPALRSRIIQVTPHVIDVKIDTTYYRAYHFYRSLKMKDQFGATYIPWIVNQILPWDEAVALSDEFCIQYNVIIPERILHNLRTVLCGAILFIRFVNEHGGHLLMPPLSAFTELIENVYHIKFGDVKLACDEFVEDVMTAISMQELKVPFALDTVRNLVWVAKKPAYDWWIVERSKRRLPAIEYRALQQQIGERYLKGNSYIAEPGKYKNIRGASTMCFAFDIQLCATQLDTPEQFVDNLISINLGV